MVSVTQHSAQKADRALQRAIGDQGAWPQLFQELFFRDHTVAVFHEVHQQVENERLQRAFAAV